MATRAEQIKAATAAAVARNRAAGGTNWNQTGQAQARQYATAAPSSTAIWDQASAGWIDPNAAPGQHFTASAYQSNPAADTSGAMFGSQLAQVAPQAKTNFGFQGVQGPQTMQATTQAAMTARQRQVQAALAQMPAAQRQFLIQRAMAQQQGGQQQTQQQPAAPLTRTPGDYQGQPPISWAPQFGFQQGQSNTPNAQTYFPPMQMVNAASPTRSNGTFWGG